MGSLSAETNASLVARASGSAGVVVNPETPKSLASVVCRSVTRVEIAWPAVLVAVGHEGRGGRRVGEQPEEVVAERRPRVERGLGARLERGVAVEVAGRDASRERRERSVELCEEGRLRDTVGGGAAVRARGGVEIVVDLGLHLARAEAGRRS